MKKRPFTLLEVLIALGLTMMIMTFLLLAYAQSEKISSGWRQQEQKEFSKLFLQHRLGEVFRNLEEVNQEKTFFFTLDEIPGVTLPQMPVLVFSYDNGFLRDPYLSRSVLGALFVDLKGALNLITWPERELWGDLTLPPFHREVLMEDLVQFQLEFFQTKGEKEAGWLKEAWTKEIKSFPGAIKLTAMKKNEPPQTFYFPVPETLSVIRVPK